MRRPPAQFDLPEVFAGNNRFRLKLVDYLKMLSGAISDVQISAVDTPYLADETTLHLTGSTFSVKTGGIGATQLASTTVTPGSYTLASITVDADGRITAASNGSAGTGTVTTTGTPSSGNITKFSGATSITNGDLSGDVTTSGTLATTIANDAVTYAKMQNVSAASKLLGRGDSGSGDPQEITLGSGLSMSGTTLSVSGSGTTGKHAIYIAAGSIRPSATGGCASITSVTSGSNLPDITSLDFDAATEEYGQFSVVMPKSWNEGTVTAKFHWSHAATVTSFQVVWGLQGVAVSDDDTIGASYGTGQTVTDTGGTTNDLYTSSETSAITIAGSPAAEDMVFFRVYRKAADASDNMTIDARLHGVTLYITTDAESDA